MSSRQIENLRRFADRCYVWFVSLLPTLLMTRLVFTLSRIRHKGFKNAFINFFVWRYKVDLSEAEFEKPGSYPDFSAFFTRALKPGARKMDPDDHALISPADGRISQAGPIRGGQLIQAKGHAYSVEALLGSAELAPLFTDGHFCTIYLAPSNYHRVHMPLSGRLRTWTYVPGRLFSVNEKSARLVPGLFTRNERVGAVFDTSYGPMAMVMVGALLVGSIETAWAGRITPPHNHAAGEYAAAKPLALLRGAEMGRFNMGSTVIMLLPRGVFQPRPFVKAGTPVRMGLGLGRMTPPART